MSLYDIYHKDDEPNTNLVARNHFTRDGHGGRSEEHREEMRQIAREVFAEETHHILQEVERMYYKAYQQAIEDFLHALEYDIESVTTIGIEGCRDIFTDKKAQKFISDHIMKTIEKNLKSKHFKG